MRPCLTLASPLLLPLLKPSLLLSPSKSMRISMELDLLSHHSSASTSHPNWKKRRKYTQGEAAISLSPSNSFSTKKLESVVMIANVSLPYSLGRFIEGFCLMRNRELTIALISLSLCVHLRFVVIYVCSMRIKCLLVLLYVGHMRGKFVSKAKEPFVLTTTPSVKRRREELFICVLLVVARLIRDRNPSADLTLHHFLDRLMTKVVFGRFINTGRQSGVHLIIASSSRGGFALRIEV
ncbi:hypothetical protein FCM35_KLT05402 [Carex littledalei]|uniref:Uncharacterized protein n=1 Tax=Carex littledalei TaxID=544730 RepID=A0A833V9R4_9POAL|nr:hypothetical protein FCM35_KLT05402 [Carex littledalei]